MTNLPDFLITTRGTVHVYLNVPMFLRLTRLRSAGGYETTASYSANGVDWTTEHVSSIGSSERTVYVGLSLGVDDTELLYGYFDSVTLRRLQFPTLLIVR